MCGVLLTAASCLASDYSSECKSEDGKYVADDGGLYRSADEARANRLVYAILEEQVLEESEGYCLSDDPASQGQKYGNLYRKTRLKVRIGGGDGAKRAVLLCELASSGLPASYNCDHTVVTRKVDEPGPVQGYRPGSTGTWDHNGSVMKLEANAKERRLIYMNPRSGLMQAGVSANTVLFEGERTGDRYTGKARFFSKACGEQIFSVTGLVTKGERRIVLEGEAPTIDGNCRKVGKRHERLVFERAG